MKMDTKRFIYKRSIPAQSGYFLVDVVNETTREAVEEIKTQLEDYIRNAIEESIKTSMDTGEELISVGIDVSFTVKPIS